MPRQKNTRLTAIYWLIDMRPETIAAGWARGYPFYVGKTCRPARERLYEHKRDAHRGPYGKVGPRVALCGEHIRIDIVEIVPLDQDWGAREAHWIALTKFSFPDNCNVSEGGDGAAGVIRSDEWRANASIRMKGNVISAEVRAKISASLQGNQPSQKSRQKTTARLTKQWQSDDYRRKMTAVSNATWADAKTKEAIRAKHRERWKDPTYRAIVTERAKAGKTAEHYKKHAEMMRAKWATEEHRNKVAAGQARRAAQVASTNV